MNIESFREHCISKKGVTESFPFPKLPDVLVFKVCGKMFAVTDINSFDSITIKCHPDNTEELRAAYTAVTEPPYMSKNHWNSIHMDNTLPDKLIKQWIDGSYNLVVAKLTKKEREVLQDR